MKGMEKGEKQIKVNEGYGNQLVKYNDEKESFNTFKTTRKF